MVRKNNPVCSIHIPVSLTHASPSVTILTFDVPSLKKIELKCLCVQYYSHFYNYLILPPPPNHFKFQNNGPSVSKKLHKDGKKRMRKERKNKNTKVTVCYLYL